MSLALSISNQNQHVIAIDKAISINRGDELYRVINKTCTKFRVVGNTLYFVCGDMELSNAFLDKIAKAEDHSLENVITVAKTVWQTNKEDYLAIGVYGFTQDGKTQLSFFGSGNNFTPMTVHGDSTNLHCAYGFRMAEASKLLTQSPKQDIKAEMISIFQTLSSEGVGAGVDFVVLDVNGVKHISSHELIEDISNFNTTIWFENAKPHFYFVGTGYNSFPVMEWGAGSGASEDAEKVKIYKQDQDFVIVYNNSATAGLGKTKKVVLSDQEASIVVDSASGVSTISIDNSGQIKAVHWSGSTLNMGHDVTIEAKGALKLKGQRIDLN
ncbi:hypothetical protein [Brevibacillus agri]|uniref:hypothetical protein n=1 Tax=Brevibacillus agri TaxID=51101 RepID=UPI003D72589D